MDTGEWENRTALPAAERNAVRLPKRPTIFEINTAVWLRRLGAEEGRGPLRLDEVPASAWDRLGSLGIDAVWLMGVGQRSALGRELALADPGRMAAMRDAVPDLRDEDAIGSPYCVREYVVDERFGGNEALAVAREELARRGLGLLLGFIPNHVAPDHAWLAERPELLIRGTEHDLLADPESFIETPDGIFARGRDPFFPAWPDVVQVNGFSPALREAHVEILSMMAERCDGVRCDMAMLMCTDIFARTWGERAGVIPDNEYWVEIIGAVKAQRPDFTFIAEAYWDTERRLQEQGFDYCYDKLLYDYLLDDDAEAARAHLRAGVGYQDKLLRFVENHDEPRATTAFGPDRARVAAVVTSMLPGARLFHDGQFDGLRTHVPVFLNRGPVEPADPDTQEFYRRLLGAIADSGLRDAAWSIAEVSGWPDNDSQRNLVAWQWWGEAGSYVVVANLTAESAQARVHLTGDWARRDWSLDDPINDQHFNRSGDELAQDGLYVDLAPWQFHFFAFTEAGTHR